MRTAAIFIILTAALFWTACVVGVLTVADHFHRPACFAASTGRLVCDR